MAMLRVHLMQNWFCYSDPAMEEALYETTILRQFSGLHLDRIPDETTIFNFRRLLEKHELAGGILQVINGYLGDRGLMLRQGTVVDATIIHAPSSTQIWNTVMIAEGLQLHHNPRTSRRRNYPMADKQSTTRVIVATEADIDGIVTLQAVNQMSQGGMLSAELPRSRIAQMIKAMPLIVACNGDEVTGFLMTTPRAMNADIAIVKAMFAVYQGSEDAYVYGPICVGASERGKGLAQTMFAELKQRQPGREGILFIRDDNEASLKAHTRMGMRQVADFQFNGFTYIVFSYIG